MSVRLCMCTSVAIERNSGKTVFFSGHSHISSVPVSFINLELVRTRSIRDFVFL